MKKILFIMFAVLLSTATFSQTFNYQAAARDNAGDVIVNQNLGVELSILQGSAQAVIFQQLTGVQEIIGFK